VILVLDLPIVFDYEIVYKILGTSKDIQRVYFEQTEIDTANQEALKINFFLVIFENNSKRLCL